MLLLPITAAFVLGATQPAIKLGLEAWPNPLVAALVGYAISSLVLIAIAVFRTRGWPQGLNSRGIVLLAGVGVCHGLAVLTMFGAFALGPITLASPTVATYPLVTHSGDAQSMRAGRTYLGLLLGTSLGLQLLAILWTWQIAGTLDFQDGGILEGRISDAMAGLLLFLYVFGIGKAALMPLHRWLPAAMVAPTPVSALLHAVAVVKAGVFAILKVVIYVFGLDFLKSLDMSQWLMYAAAATILIASLVALNQAHLKARLASSASFSFWLLRAF